MTRAGRVVLYLYLYTFLAIIWLGTLLALRDALGPACLVE